MRPFGQGDATMQRNQMSARAWVMLLAVAALWACSFPMTTIAVAGLPPVAVAFGRAGIAAVLLAAYAALSGQPFPRDMRTWAALTLMGTLNNAIPFVLIAWGQLEVSAGLASILVATSPFFTAVLAHFVTDDERLRPGKVIGCAIGVAGLIILIGPDALSGGEDWLLATAAILAASVSYACAGVFGKRLRRLPATIAATGMLAGGSIVLVPALVLSVDWQRAVPGASLAAVAGLAVLGTTLAYVLYFRILNLAGATNLLVVTILVPPGAIAIGAVALGEPVSFRSIAGFIVIVCGLIVIDGRLRPFRNNKRH